MKEKVNTCQNCGKHLGLFDGPLCFECEDLKKGVDSSQLRKEVNNSLNYLQEKYDLCPSDLVKIFTEVFDERYSKCDWYY